VHIINQNYSSQKNSHSSQKWNRIGLFKITHKIIKNYKIDLIGNLLELEFNFQQKVFKR
jgi:hypothetical protein